ncbi:hypothetical protein PA598K_06164 [Paenibacillus sp. 598K]|uniref:M24 family metallopeptidase n=1 Tax=Paenibacillus sp. 598K TaxID=1117987 RepID=UPI000FF90A8C|nr:M24 family metallopeptidase [Paenibacillus sp. 598K]GBF77607.1 hypothetical protein PA598K_06164 [Paenibacillus sp. 598K]
MNAQEVAMEACRRSKAWLKPGISERAFADICEAVMRELGADDFWYPMLVNFGANTVYCTRGGHLPADDVYLQETDIVLVDYSPLVDGRWGDYSETILVGTAPDPAWERLVADARDIFAQTYAYAARASTIGELFDYCESLIRERGYALLDPGGNIGHSIEDGQRQALRTYLSPVHASEPLAGKRWAIEPHIGKDGYGAKFENVIYIPGEAQR